MSNDPQLIGCALNGRGQYSAVVLRMRDAIESVADSRSWPWLPRFAQHHRMRWFLPARPGDYFMVFDYKSGEQTGLVVKGRTATSMVMFTH